MNDINNLNKLMTNIILELFPQAIIDKLPTIEISNDLNKADYVSTVAFHISKTAKESPINIANKITLALTSYLKISTTKINCNIEVAPPGFINFRLSEGVFYDYVCQAINEKDNYGKSDELHSIKLRVYDTQLNKSRPKKYLIEHTSPNPNKEMHIGHLKNNITGIAISNLLKFQGAEVYNDMVNNNRGIAIARLMWGYLKFARKSNDTEININYWYKNPDKWHTPESTNKKPGKFIDELYVLGTNDCSEDKNSEQIVRQMVIDWEAGKEENIALWKLTQSWVWDDFKKVLNRIKGWQFDHIWHESDHYQKGKDLILSGIEKGIFKKLEDGAVITDLAKFNLTDTVLLKNDGTSLYITQDIALTKLKKEKFQPDVMMWVIGPEQSLQMKQMFAVCSQLGIGNFGDFIHVPYGFVLTKKSDGTIGKASSREGSFHANELIDSMKQKILNYVKPNFSQSLREEISEKLAIASIKYSLLKVNRTQDLVFDPDVSISLEGDSAPYILYSLVRAKSILKEVHNDEIKKLSSNEIMLNNFEKELMWMIAKYQNTLHNATKLLNPAIVCNYIYDLSNSFNKFYANCPVLKTDETTKILRIEVTKAFVTIMQNSLKILNIDWVEIM